MSTFAHGIATAQMIDSSGEIVDIKGHDISSLAKTGVLNYEHNSSLPAQVVAKILSAKKIYTAEDCANEHETKFWNLVKVPFVYIVAEMFDDYCESAKDAAGKLRYSYDRPQQIGVLHFSVEGGSIPGTKEGVTIKRSIARKVSLTVNPCNKMCIAELMPPQQSQVKDDFESIFKSQEKAIESFKKGEAVSIYEEFLAKKEENMQKSGFGTFGAMKPRDPGAKLGSTGSGKDVFANQHVHDYKDFSSQDHKDAVGLHTKAAQGAAGNHKLAYHHSQKMKLHNSAANTAMTRENRLQTGMQAKKTAAAQHMNKMEKTLTAGSTDAAPSSLTNGAAFQKENLKKEWSKRAKDEYSNWKHREKFEKFMKSQMPHLADGEIRAIGRVVALQKSITNEAELEKLVTKLKK